MEKIFKKSLALMVSAALCLTAFVGCLTVNAEETATPTYTITAQNGKAGDTVEVKVDGTNLTSVCGQQLFINIPSDLTIASVKDNAENAYVSAAEAAEGEAYDYNVVTTENTKQVRFVDIINFPAEGELDPIATAEFHVVFGLTIPEGAEAGKTYTIGSDDLTMFANYGEEEIAITVAPATINVLSAEHVHAYGEWVYDSENFNYYRTCECGEKETKDLVKSDSTVDITYSGKSLLVEDAIAIVYYVPASSLESYDGFYLDVVQTRADGTTKTAKLNGTYSAGYGGEYKFQYEGIAAKEMGDDVVATIYVVSNGEAIAGASVNYNPITYATNQLNKTTTKAALKKVLVDMLNYGAEAQKYFTYNVDNLANASLTEEQVALGTQETPSTTNYRDYGATNDTQPVKHTAPTLSSESRVEIVYYMDIANYTGDANNLSLEVTKDDKTTVIPFSEFALSSGTEYKASFAGLAAKEMRTLCTFKVYENYGTESQLQVSSDMVYSIESYVAGRKTTSAVYNVSIAMMKFGDSAAAYFAS